MNEKINIQIGNRKLTVEMEGLTPLEINALAQKVSERVVEMQGHNSGVADTSKIALLVALSFAAELSKERSAHDLTRRLLENKAESLSESLRDSLKMSSDSNE
jgi:cell division protein ZapA (FtsZ GTPase activity inhibitor)